MSRTLSTPARIRTPEPGMPGFMPLDVPMNGAMADATGAACTYATTTLNASPGFSVNGPDDW